MTGGEVSSEPELSHPSGWSGWVAALVAPAALLVVDPAGWYPFGPLKFTAVAVLVLAGVALTRSRPGAAAWPALTAAGALVASMAFGAVVGLDPLYGWVGTPERRAGVVLWVVAAGALVLGASVGRRWVGRGFVAGGFVVGALGVAEVLGWEPALLEGGARITGTLGSSAFLGAAVALALPVVLGRLVGAVRPGSAAGDTAPGGVGRGGASWRAVGAGGTRRGADRAKVALLVATVVLLTVTVVASGARSAWLGLVVAAAVTLLARPGRPRAKVGLAAVGAVAVVAVIALTPAGSRLNDLGDADAPGGRGRLDEWRIATRVIADHPITGVGPEGYRIAFGGHADDRYEIAHGRDPLPDRAHSAPLDMALAGGLPAAIAWVAFWAAVAWRAWPQLRRGSPAAAGCAAGLVAHVVGQLALFPLAELEPVAWLLAGAVIVGDERPVPRSSPSKHGLGWATVRVVAALSASVLAVAGGLEVRADRAGDRAAEALAKGHGRDALVHADRAVSLRPDIVRLHLLRARSLLAAERGSHAALDALADAERVSPDDPVVRRERLRLLVARAESTGLPRHGAEAYTESLDAVERDPSSGDLWLVVGQAAYLAGERDESVRAYLRAEELSPDRPDAALALAVIYAEVGDRAAAERALDRARLHAPDPRIDRVGAAVEAILAER